MKKILSILVATVLSISISFSQSSDKSQTTEQLMETAGKRSVEKVKAGEIEKVIQEALAVFQKSQQLLFQLTHNQIDQAKKTVKEIQQRLEKLDKQYKGKIDKLPIQVVIIEVDGIDDIELAEKLKKEAKKLLEENDVPSARDILNALRNEIVIETHYLPLEIYKDTIDLVAKFLEKNNIPKAVEALNIALGTIEIEQTIIPKPIAEAVLLVQDAKAIFKEDKKSALQLLEEAKRKLKLAKALGYIRTEKEIEPLIKEIEKLEKQIRKETAEKVLFESLEKKIKQTQEKATETKQRK
ncbi:MAG: YfdX family protein [Aquificae bacterium]|nr:YfdX family protein [Aquificota bacterium]